MFITTPTVKDLAVRLGIDLPGNNLRWHPINLLALLNHALTAGPAGSLLRADSAHAGREERNVAVTFIVPHANISSDDTDPVEVVTQHGSIGGRVGPAEKGVEDTPSTTATQFGVAAVDVPDTLADIVGTSSRTRFGRITTDDIIPGVVLEVPDCTGEETSGDEVEEAGRDDQEVLQGGSVTTSIAEEILARTASPFSTRGQH